MTWWMRFRCQSRMPWSQSELRAPTITIWTALKNLIALPFALWRLNCLRCKMWMARKSQSRNSCSRCTKALSKYRPSSEVSWQRRLWWGRGNLWVKNKLIWSIIWDQGRRVGAIAWSDRGAIMFLPTRKRNSSILSLICLARLIYKLKHVRVNQGALVALKHLLMVVSKQQLLAHQRTTILTQATTISSWEPTQNRSLRISQTPQ